MANSFLANVYQLNGLVYPRDAPVKWGFPTSGLLYEDISTSPTRSLSSGYNVYSLIILGSNSDLPLGPRYFYLAETITQLAALIG